MLSKWTFKIIQVAGDDIKEKKKNIYSVGIGPVRFQLQYMGHYLLRDERKDPDPRVQDFIPDTWQVMAEGNKHFCILLLNAISEACHYCGSTYYIYYELLKIDILLKIICHWQCKMWIFFQLKGSKIFISFNFHKQTISLEVR